jgi:hypothetical protein
MSRTLSLDIPDELYQALQDFASRDGKTPEDVSVAWLTAMMECIANDPLMKLAGTLDSGVPDLAERHDEYLGQQLEAELQDQEG